MRKLMLILLTMISFAVFVPTLLGQDLNLANLPADDVKVIRKIIADRDYQQARADEATRQAGEWQKSAASWQKLYQSEKDRADRVQGGRIDELLKANSAYKDQAEQDRQRLGENAFTIRKLKSERKWYFALGFGTGAVAGVYGARKFSF